jgi:hypothetical protein
MGSEITNTVTIYEVSGVKYTGARKIYIKTHPRFLSFVRLCIDNQEYSLASDDLMRAVDGALSRQPVQEDDVLIGGQANLINQFAKELTTEKQERDADLPPR